MVLVTHSHAENILMKSPTVYSTKIAEQITRKRHLCRVIYNMFCICASESPGKSSQYLCYLENMMDTDFSSTVVARDTLSLHDPEEAPLVSNEDVALNPTGRASSDIEVRRGLYLVLRNHSLEFCYGNLMSGEEWAAPKLP